MRAACFVVGLTLTAACGCGGGSPTAAGTGDARPPAPKVVLTPTPPTEPPIEKVAPMPREVKR